MKIHPLHLGLAGIFLVLALMGCSGGSKEKISPTVENQVIDTEALISNPRQGLDGLASYQMRAVNEFSGDLNGEAQHTRMEISASEIRSSKTEFVTLRQTTAGGKLEVILMGRVGDASYSRFGDDKSVCHVTWGSTENSAPFIWPTDVLPEIIAAKKIGNETINTIPSIHYSLDKNSLINNAEDIKGDVWLAEPGGYIVKFNLTMTGGEKTYGKGRKGTQTVTYEMTGINAIEKFELPEGCQPVLTEISTLPDATRVNRMPDFLRYFTASSVNDVFAFYKKELGALGWQSGNSHPMQDGGEIMIFVNQNNPESYQITAAKETGGSMVSVTKVNPPIQNQKAGQTGSQTPAASHQNTIDPAKAGLPDGVPVYPGAKDFTGVEGMRLVFTTTDPVEKVKEFYKTNLKKAGWAAMPGTESIANAPMMFQKNGVNLIIQLTKQDSGSQVSITFIKIPT